MRAVIDDAVEERLGLDALAHQPALHVGDRHDQGVDPPVADHGLELLEPGMVDGMVVVSHREHSWPLRWRAAVTVERVGRTKPVRPSKPDPCYEAFAGEPGTG